MSGQPDGAEAAKPKSAREGSAIDELIREVLPTLRADVVRAVLGWPISMEGLPASRSETGWPQ
jgi:hypothetical protein